MSAGLDLLNFFGAEADVFKALAGDLLLELGYESDNSWSPVEGEPPR